MTEHQHECAPLTRGDIGILTDLVDQLDDPIPGGCIDQALFQDITTILQKRRKISQRVRDFTLGAEEVREHSGVHTHDSHESAIAHHSDVGKITMFVVNAGLYVVFDDFDSWCHYVKGVLQVCGEYAKCYQIVSGDEPHSPVLAYTNTDKELDIDTVRLIRDAVWTKYSSRTAFVNNRLLGVVEIVLVDKKISCESERAAIYDRITRELRAWGHGRVVDNMSVMPLMCETFMCRHSEYSTQGHLYHAIDNSLSPEITLITNHARYSKSKGKAAL